MHPKFGAFDLEINSFFKKEYNVDLLDLKLKLITENLGKNTITFIDNFEYLQKIQIDSGPVYMFVPLKYVESEFPSTIVVLPTPDPRLMFYSLHNYLSLEGSNYEFESEVDSKCRIHPTAVISPTGVRILGGSEIGPFTVIEAGTSIGSDCVIQAGAKLGLSGFEFKRTLTGIISVRHENGLEIGNNVQVGANSTIGNGFLGTSTKILDDSKIDFGVSIAHRSQVGRRVFIAAGAVISGSVEIGDDCWIGPSATLSNGIRIGHRSFVALGSVVVSNFDDDSRLMGVPARKVPTR
jgi:acetyltransferase-like isoleucine patch superfamily enzyme